MNVENLIFFKTSPKNWRFSHYTLYVKNNVFTFEKLINFLVYSGEGTQFLVYTKTVEKVPSPMH